MEFPFRVSYQPSSFLSNKVEFWEDPEAYIYENMHETIKFAALGSSRIRMVTTVFGARHEYVLVSVGSDPSLNFQKQGWFRQRDYYRAEFILIEFSKFRDSDEDAEDKAGIINLSTFCIGIKESEAFHEGFSRRSKKSGLCLESYNYQDDDITLTLGDVLLMAGALATAGYDLVHNNCRHFARGLFVSVQTGEPVPGFDNEQRILRRVAKYLDLHGSTESAQSLLSSSYAASVTMQLLFVAFEVASSQGLELAIELATDSGIWKVVRQAIADLRASKRITDY